MKAKTQYTDMIGTVAADISDFSSNRLDDLAESFNVDLNRFKVVGISIYGTDEFNVCFICVDKIKSNEGKEHIVKLYLDGEYTNILSILFKRFEAVLYNYTDSKYPDLDYDEEISLSELDQQ